MYVCYKVVINWYHKTERDGKKWIRTHQSFGSETGTGSDETTEIADPQHGGCRGDFPLGLRSVMGFAVAVHRRLSEIEKLTLTLIETRERYMIGSEIPLAPISNRTQKRWKLFSTVLSFFLLLERFACTNLLHLFVLIRLLISVFLFKFYLLMVFKFHCNINYRFVNDTSRKKEM